MVILMVGSGDFSVDTKVQYNRYYKFVKVSANLFI